MPNDLGDSTKALVDTNVFIYAYDPRDPDKKRKAENLIKRLSDANCLVVSTQIVNEFCSVLLRGKTGSMMNETQLTDFVDEMMAVADVVPITLATTKLALQATKIHAFSFWDALVWAAAKTNQIPTVYSEDFSHGKLVEGVRFTNPFLATS